MYCTQVLPRNSWPSSTGPTTMVSLTLSLLSTLCTSYCEMLTSNDCAYIATNNTKKNVPNLILSFHYSKVEEQMVPYLKCNPVKLPVLCKQNGGVQCGRKVSPRNNRQERDH